VAGAALYHEVFARHGPGTAQAFSCGMLMLNKFELTRSIKALVARALADAK
jgi:hypothetical protein